MCYNLSYIERREDKLRERYKNVQPTPLAERQLNLPLFHFVSGFDHPQLPIINHNGIELFHWGLIPWWIKDASTAKSIQPQTLNAVGETVFEKPAFKDAIVKQRCLIPVNGFFEWQDFKKVKYQHYIKVKSNDIFSLGGLYSTWTDKTTGEIHSTFGVITTPANPLMEKIHNLKKRMS